MRNLSIDVEWLNLGEISTRIAIAENMKDFCLLEHGIRERTVRMHSPLRMDINPLLGLELA